MNKRFLRIAERIVIAESSQEALEEAKKLIKDGQSVSKKLENIILRDGETAVNYAELCLENNVDIPPAVIKRILDSTTLVVRSFAEYIVGNGLFVEESIKQLRTILEDRIAISSLDSVEYAKFLSKKGIDVPSNIQNRIEKGSIKKEDKELKGENAYKLALNLINNKKEIPDKVINGLFDENGRYAWWFAEKLIEDKREDEVPKAVMDFVKKNFSFKYHRLLDSIKLEAARKQKELEQKSEQEGIVNE